VTDPGQIDLRFPIGKFRPAPPGTPDARAGWIDQILRAPENLAGHVRGLSDAQLATPYRDGGWTVAQVVNHMADSHMNAYLRTRWALTETGYVVKPYDEKMWAELADSRALDVAPSLDILRGVHTRWVTLLRSMSDADFARPMTHPERGPIAIDWLVQLYAWHGRHHTAHITALKTRSGW